MCSHRPPPTATTLSRWRAVAMQCYEVAAQLILGKQSTAAMRFVHLPRRPRAWPLAVNGELAVLCDPATGKSGACTTSSCNDRSKATMRALVKWMIVAVAFGIFTAQLQASPIRMPSPRSYAPLTHLVQDSSDHYVPYYYRDHYLPACGSGLQYACYFDPDGTRRCGCWHADVPACPSGYRYTCLHNANGGADIHCACY